MLTKIRWKLSENMEFANCLKKRKEQGWWQHLQSHQKYSGSTCLNIYGSYHYMITLITMQVLRVFTDVLYSMIFNYNSRNMTTCESKLKINCVKKIVDLADITSSCPQRKQLKNILKAAHPGDKVNRPFLAIFLTICTQSISMLPSRVTVYLGNKRIVHSVTEYTMI